MIETYSCLSICPLSIAVSNLTAMNRLIFRLMLLNKSFNFKFYSLHYNKDCVKEKNYTPQNLTNNREELCQYLRRG